MNIVFMSMDTLPSTLWVRDLYAPASGNGQRPSLQALPPQMGVRLSAAPVPQEVPLGAG